MTRKKIIHIADSYYREIKKQASKIGKKLDKEAIHQFRVTYKKLRAFLRMLSSAKAGTDKTGVSSKLKDMYGIAGCIRDLQLQQQRIREAVKKESRKPSQYFALLRGEIRRLEPDLSDLFSANPIAHSRDKNMAIFPKTFAVASFRSFVQQKWNAIYLLILSAQFTDEKIHEIRKILKDLLYNLGIYEGVEHKILTVSTWREREEKYFKDILDELGKFQDKCRGIALLKIHWVNSLSTHSRLQLEAVKRKWIKEKMIMKRMLVRKLKTELLPEGKSSK